MPGAEIDTSRLLIITRRKPAATRLDAAPHDIDVAPAYRHSDATGSAEDVGSGNASSDEGEPAQRRVWRGPLEDDCRARDGRET